MNQATTSLTRTGPSDNCVIRGRNDELFHTLRLWAYSAVHSHSSEEVWHLAMLKQAEEINTCFADPLGYSEVKATSKAVAKWVWKHRHELNGRTKVLKFTNESPAERMSAGAAYTNEKRRETSLAIVRAAYQELLPIYGEKLTPRILSAHTGQNIKTIRKYLPLI